MASIVDILEQQKKYWPEWGKIYNYYFITQITNKTEVNMGWQKKIERRVEIIYLDKKEGLRFFQVLTPKITLTSNKAFPNKNLILKLGYLFDNLELGINNKGIIKKIFNMHDLKTRFLETKVFLEKDYVGSDFEQIIIATQQLVENQENLIGFLQSYKMFGMYFNGLYQEYQKESKNPVIRDKILHDFNQTCVEEKINFVSENNNYTFNVLINNPTNPIENHKGVYKTTYNQLETGYIETETEETNINYSALWVG